MTSTYSISNPPVSPLIGSVKGSFAEDTFLRRIPAILNKVARTLDEDILGLKISGEASKAWEGKELAERIRVLAESMKQDAALEVIPDDGADDAKGWIALQKEHFPKGTWFSVPWMFGECYTYRLLKAWFTLTGHWGRYDPFLRQKDGAYIMTLASIRTLGRRYVEEVVPGKTGKGEAEIFRELALVCLWGNRADLSLLADLSTAPGGEDGKGIEVKGDEEGDILANDLDRLWEYVQGIKGGRVDIILDNSGFELFGDLLLADYLMMQGHAAHVRFHGKAIPWFVSDVMRHDVKYLVDALLAEKDTALATLGARWEKYIAEGRWSWAWDEFWTSPLCFWHLPEQETLWGELKETSLLIFKGDLNHRKLLYDGYWPHTTAFTTSIGPLASRADAPPLLTLRTCKSDIVVGLGEGLAEKMEAEHPGWMVTGEFAVIQFSRGSRR